MPVPGLRITGLSGSLDPEALAARRLALVVEGGTLRVGAGSLRHLLPPGAPLDVERIAGGRIHVRASMGSVGGTAEVVPRATAAGRLRLEIALFRAAGFMPLPATAVTWALRSFLPAHPAVHFGEGSQLELDLASLLAPLGIRLGPLQRAVVEESALELRF